MNTPEAVSRDVMEYDVVTVGAGPGGLAFAIRAKQLKPDLRVCVIEKASSIGAQILSGAVIEPEALEALLRAWRENPPPICVPVTHDEFWWLRDHARGMKLPLTPPQMNNHGNFIVSLGAMCAWLAPQAEALGVEIYPGFAASELLHDESGNQVIGVRIGDMGVARDGTHKPGYTQGIDIHAKGTVLAEGARGAGQDRAPHGLAGGFEDLRRQLPVPPGWRSHRAGLRERPRLPGSEVPALRGLPAVEEPSAHQVTARRRQHPERRRARH